MNPKSSQSLDNTTGSIKVGKFQLNYRIEGQGIPAIVIGSSIYYPRTFSQKLREHFKMIFVDHRGFSKKPDHLEPADYELDVILDDIEEVRKALNLDHVAIIGHSGHGYLALEYAKKYPESVSQIVLIAISPDSSQKSFEAADRYFQESVCPKRKELLAKNLATLQDAIAANPDQAFITRSLVFGPMIWYDEKFDATDLWKDIKVIPEIVDHLWGKVFREVDITTGLEKVDHPVYLALGRYDYWNPPYLWEEVRTKFKNLTIRVFEKSGHTPQFEEPELFNEELLSWIKLG